MRRTARAQSVSREGHGASVKYAEHNKKLLLSFVTSPSFASFARNAPRCQCQGWCCSQGAAWPRSPRQGLAATRNCRRRSMAPGNPRWRSPPTVPADRFAVDDCSFPNRPTGVLESWICLRAGCPTGGECRGGQRRACAGVRRLRRTARAQIVSREGHEDPGRRAEQNKSCCCPS